MAPTLLGGTQDTDINKAFTKGLFFILLVFLLRSNFNSRGVNSRELFWFFGHSSLSHHAFLTKIGGNFSYKPPGPP